MPGTDEGIAVAEQGGPGAVDGPVEQAVTARGFDEFYRSERLRLVKLLALSISDASLAESAIDEAMTRAWARWDTIADPAPWVYRVARNWATSWWRRRRHLSSSPVPEVAVDGQDPGGNPRLRSAIDQLSHDHRAVVALRIVAGYSVREAAVALGIAEGTVTSRTARALDKLRDAMEGSR